MVHMFTLEEIDKIHERFGNAETLAQYLQALWAIGVLRQDSFITDGHSEYYGQDGYTVSSPTIHGAFPVANASNQKELLQHLDLHGQHKTSYLEMVKGLADSGVEKWTFDTNAMTITYYDRAGNIMKAESVESKTT